MTIATKKNQRNDNAGASDDGKVGAIICELGGNGSKAGNKNQLMMDREALPMPVVRLQIDMDQNEPSTADVKCCIALSAENGQELVSNAARFGLENAVKHLAPMLDPEELEAGARTTPGLTQLGFIYHLARIIRAFITAIALLKQDRRVERIRLILVSSNGGGAGSALTRLIPWCLGQRKFRERILAGLDPFTLQAPIILTSSPFTYSRHSATERQAVKIMANQYAWFREVDELLFRNLVSHVLTVGYSNSSGTVLHSPERMVDVLATSLHHFLRNYRYFRSRWTDTIPNPQTDWYLGIDLPENLYESVRQLRIKYYGEEDLR